MRTPSVDGSPVNRYQGRIGGLIDLEDEVDHFAKGDIVMAVVVLHAKRLLFDDNAKGETIGTYGFVVKDFALVTDEQMRKQLYFHLPHLEPPAQLPFPEAVDPALTAWQDGHAVEDVIHLTAEQEEQPEWPAPTVVTTDDLTADDVLAHDAEDGEVFSPEQESRERARLASTGRDPILQQFLNGD